MLVTINSISLRFIWMKYFFKKRRETQMWWKKSLLKENCDNIFFFNRSLMMHEIVTVCSHTTSLPFTILCWCQISLCSLQKINPANVGSIMKSCACANTLTLISMKHLFMFHMLIGFPWKWRYSPHKAFAVCDFLLPIAVFLLLKNIPIWVNTECVLSPFLEWCYNQKLLFTNCWQQ